MRECINKGYGVKRAFPALSYSNNNQTTVIDKGDVNVVRVDVTEMLIRPLSFDFDPKKISSLYLTTRLRVVWEYSYTGTLPLALHVRA